MPGSGSPPDTGDEAELRRRRLAIFGEDPLAGADERDPGDGAGAGSDGGSDGGEDAATRWYREQRPPHHGG